MEEKTEIKAVELVRSIRDRQAELLVGKSNKEIIEFFRKAGDTARRAASPPPPARSKAKNRLQADTR
jgi:hypothetical protein